MNCPFYKSLDREFEVFGIKGHWVKNFLLLAGAIVFLGVFVGFILSSGVAVAFVVVCLGLDFLFCISMQTKLPSRQYPRSRLSGRTEGWVLRRETLSRIVFEDPRYEEVQTILKTLRSHYGGGSDKK